MPSPVYEVAGQLDRQDPLAEEIVATLFSDQPTRSVERPRDSRRHWQWFARDASGQTSRIWVGYAGPISDLTIEQLQQRAESSLAVFVPDYATAIAVRATQGAVDEIDLVIEVDRRDAVGLTISLLVRQGGSGA